MEQIHSLTEYEVLEQFQKKSLTEVLLNHNITMHCRWILRSVILLRLDRFQGTFVK